MIPQKDAILLGNRGYSTPPRRLASSSVRRCEEGIKLVRNVNNVFDLKYDQKSMGPQHSRGSKLNSSIIKASRTPQNQQTPPL